MKRIRSEMGQKKVDLDLLKEKTEHQQDELEALMSQRRSLEAAINNLRKDKVKLEEGHKMVEKRTGQLQRSVITGC